MLSLRLGLLGLRGGSLEKAARASASPTNATAARSSNDNEVAEGGLILVAGRVGVNV